MVEREVRVNQGAKLNTQGAMNIVSRASGFESSILIVVGSKTINAKSIMGVLAIGLGTVPLLKVTADGRGERAALDAVCKSIMEQL